MTDPDFYPINPDEELNPDSSPGQLFVNRKSRFLQLGEDEGLPTPGAVEADGTATPLRASQSFVTDVDGAGNPITFALTSGDTYTCTSRFMGLFNYFGGATLGLSLRRLSRGYTGPLIRVRRDSDDDELEIGYNSSGFLDTETLASFVPSGDGFVTRWYNQALAGTFFEEGDDAGTPKPPRIVSSGSIISDGATRPYPAIEFPGTRWLVGDNFSADKDFSTYVICSFDILGGIQHGIYDNSLASPFGDGYGMIVNSLGNAVAWQQDVSKSVFSAVSVINQQKQISYTGDSSDLQKLYLDASLVDTQTSTPGSRNAAAQTTIGKDASGGFLNGKMQELIAYDIARDANAYAIATLQNEFYQIY